MFQNAIKVGKTDGQSYISIEKIKFNNISMQRKYKEIKKKEEE